MLKINNKKMLAYSEKQTNILIYQGLTKTNPSYE